MITVTIAVLGIVLFWQNRGTAGCWVAAVFILIFLFLAAGATVPLDTLRRANDGLDRVNTSMMRWNAEQAERDYQTQLRLNRRGNRP